MALIERIDKEDYTWACLVCAVVVAGLLALHVCLQHNSYPEQVGVLTTPAKVTMECPMGSDTVRITVPKGKQLAVLGLKNARYNREIQIMMASGNGVRGYVSAREMGLPMVLSKTGDTATVTKHDTKYHTYTFRTRDGREEKRSYSKVRPALPEGLTHQRLDADGRCLMSVQKFERKYLGHSVEENDLLTLPATAVVCDKKGARAYYGQTRLYNPADGRFYHPTVTYDDSLRAVAYELTTLSKNRVPAFLPLAGPIIDSKPAQWFLRRSAFLPGSHYESSNVVRWLTAFGLLLLKLVLYLMVPVIPIALLGGLVRVHWVYYFLGDKTLKWFFGIVAVLTLYAWLIVLMASTKAWWIFLPINIYLLLCWFTRACAPMSQGYAIRCSHCRRMNSYKLHHTDKNYLKTEAERVSKKLSNAEALKMVREHASYYKQEEYDQAIEILKYKAIEGSVVVSWKKPFTYHELIDHYRCRCGAEYTTKRVERKENIHLTLPPGMDDMQFDYKYRD